MAPNTMVSFKKKLMKQSHENLWRMEGQTQGRMVEWAESIL